MKQQLILSSYGTRYLHVLMRKQAVASFRSCPEEMNIHENIIIEEEAMQWTPRWTHYIGSCPFGGTKTLPCHGTFIEHRISSSFSTMAAKYRHRNLVLIKNLLVKFLLQHRRCRLAGCRQLEDSSRFVPLRLKGISTTPLLVVKPRSLQNTNIRNALLAGVYSLDHLWHFALFALGAGLISVALLCGNRHHFHPPRKN